MTTKFGSSSMNVPRTSSIASAEFLVGIWFSLREDVFEGGLGRGSWALHGELARLSDPGGLLLVHAGQLFLGDVVGAEQLPRVDQHRVVIAIPVCMLAGDRRVVPGHRDVELARGQLRPERLAARPP